MHANKSSDVWASVHIRTRGDRSGRCYELAGRGIIYATDDAWRLVHGTLRDPVRQRAERYPHAWLERGDAVYDPVLDRPYEREDYYTRFNAVADRIFDKVQAAHMVHDFGHWGAWNTDGAA
jgi:hypothetical protein